MKVDEELVKKRIQIRFPNLQLDTISLIGEGWDNLAYEVNESFIFRFPKHEEACHLLQNEINVLTEIHSWVGGTSIQIPRPIFVGNSGEDFPYSFCGYKKIPGRSACSFNLNEEDRIKLAPELALFMKKLHAVPIDQATTWEIKGCAEDRMDPNLLMGRIKENLHLLQNKNLLTDMGPFLDFLQRVPEQIDRSKKTMLHGDLYARHLLLNNRKRLVGIIDWGDMDIDHPAIDYQIVYTFFPESGQKIFFEIYGAIDADTQMLAKFRALYSASGIAARGMHVHDDFLVQEGLWGLRNLLKVFS